MKFIHAADLHLCSSFVTSSLEPSVAAAHREQLWKTFHHLIDICSKDKVDVLLLSGDLYESDYARVSDVKSISDAFATIPETKVFIAPGNHDPIVKNSYYNMVKFPENTHVFGQFEGVEIEDHNAVVYGFGWEQNRYEQLPFAFSAIDKSKNNLLLLHCDAMTTSPYLPIKTELLDSLGFDYVALGHIHKAVQLKPNIFYPGSPEPLNFGEEGKHGYIKGILKDKKLELNFVNANKREFITAQIKVEPEMNTADIVEKVSSECGRGISSNIYRLIFSGIIHPQIDVDNVMREIKDSFYSVEYYDRTIPDYDIKKVYQENKDNIVGKFIQSLTKEATKDPIAYKALIKGLEALLYKQGGEL